MTTATTEPTLDGLESWLKTQNPSTSYDYTDPHDCLISRYLRHLGHRGPSVGGVTFRSGSDTGELRTRHPLPDGMDEVSVKHPRTYRGALDRIALMMRRGLP